MKQNYDIIIIGAGPVGLSLACALGSLPLQIAILEKQTPAINFNHNNYDSRVFAITRATQQFLESLDVWQDIIANRVSPYQHMHVWDSTGAGKIHFAARDLLQPDLGHIIENRVLQKALYEKVNTHDNLHFIAPIELESLQKSATLLTTSQQTLQAKLLIGADGANSWLRQQAGIELISKPYGHHAIVATVKTAKPHQQTAWQRFMPEGPLAFLPLSDAQTSSIVWSTQPEQATALQQMTSIEFKKALAKAFDYQLGEILEVSERFSFPLYKRHAKHYVQAQLALVGDAAHTVHPLAGQGVNLGFADAKALVNVISNARNKNRDIASLINLRRYERERKTANLKMLAAMDGFKNLFASQQPLLRWSRNLGLRLTDNLPPLKNALVRQAMGLEQFSVPC